MIRLFLLLTAVAFCTHCTEGKPPVTQTSNRSMESKALQPPDAATRAPDSTSGSPAQKAYVDPGSGELAPRPAGQATPEINTLQQSTRQAPAAGLQEQASPVPGGGVMIDLKGHFRKPVSTTVGGDSAAPTKSPADAHTVEPNHATP